MSIIIYGGSKETVKTQLECKHDWYGPCIDDVARFYKCLRCFCMDYDLADEKAYYQTVADRAAYHEECRKEWLNANN